MHIEFLINGSVKLLLSPENEMETEILKQFLKQDNDLTEIRSNVNILNKTIKNGVLIGKRGTIGNSTDKKEVGEQAPDDEK